MGFLTTAHPAYVPGDLRWTVVPSLPGREAGLDAWAARNTENGKLEAIDTKYHANN